MNKTVQNLAKEARIRIKRMSLVKSGDEYLSLNGKRISLPELGRMREVTAEILASDTFINPIEKLINQEEFEKVDEDNKMRYLLELSKIYLYMKSTTK